MTIGSWCWIAADLSKETGFDVWAVTLRTASAQALTSYGRCDIHLQVPPPIAGTAKVTSEVVDVRYPILSVAGLVANGYRVTFRGQESERRRNRRTADAHSRPVVLAGVERDQRDRVRRQRCGLSRVSAGLGPPREFREQYSSHRQSRNDLRSSRPRSLSYSVITGT